MQATNVKFAMCEETTLADLLQLKLHKFEDEVSGIVDKATNELNMEKIFERVGRDLVSNGVWTRAPSAHGHHVAEIERRIDRDARGQSSSIGGHDDVEIRRSFRVAKATVYDVVSLGDHFLSDRETKWQTRRVYTRRWKIFRVDCRSARRHSPNIWIRNVLPFRDSISFRQSICLTFSQREISLQKSLAIWRNFSTIWLVWSSKRIPTASRRKRRWECTAKKENTSTSTSRASASDKSNCGWINWWKLCRRLCGTSSANRWPLTSSRLATEVNIAFSRLEEGYENALKAQISAS